METMDIKQVVLNGVPIVDQIISPLKKEYPKCNSADIGGYFVWRCEQIQRMIKTLLHVLSECNDSHSSNILIRALADHTSSLKLIYCNTDRDQIILRHLLFVIDGCNERIGFNEDLKKDDNIDNNSFIRANTIITHESTAKEYCEEEIKKLQIYKDNKQLINKLIHKGNWKYKDGFISKYNWCDLYKDVLGMPNDYIGYLSQHVHGLAGGIGIEDNNADYPFLFGLVLLIQNEFSKTITSFVFPRN